MLTAVADRSYLLLQAFDRAACARAALAELGLRLPDPGHATSSGQYALLWITPKEWLLELPTAEAPPVHAALTSRLAAEGLAITTDLTHAYAVFDLGGARVLDVLNGGCSLDLSRFERGQSISVASATAPDTAQSVPAPSAPAPTPEHVARTLLADVPVILWRRSGLNGFRCIVDRSFAHHLTSWLLQSPSAA